MDRVVRKDPPHNARGTGSNDTLTDAQLLDHFLDRGDQSAFTEIVRRHETLVLAVCCRVLRDTHLAEDSCQDTFEILARRAAGLDCPGSLAGWLRVVAWKRAHRARCRLVACRGHEEPAADIALLLDWRFAEEDGKGPAEAALDPLPETYRQAVEACYVQGESVEQAAARLGCPRGTLAGRLFRGRELLRMELAVQACPRR